MKEKICLLFFCLIFFILSAPEGAGQQDADFHNKQSLEVDMTISNDINVIRHGRDYDIKNLKVFLSYMPREDFRQELLWMDYVPKDAYEYDDGVVFEWSNPDFEMQYSVNARIKTKDSLKKIRSVPNFPILEIDESLNEFLAETESVDFKDSRIKALSHSIAAGETDLFVVTHKFAEWVNLNIEYDLNTQTAEASQKASWVLENKQGVCDELTNLFIGLCRSVGIPARFVSGMAYTTDPRFDEWSPHGWAEVYFPEHGWIPFDVTYGEFGYITPGHIKLKVSDDANKSSTKYEWEAYGATIETGKLDIQTKVMKIGEDVNPYLILETSTAFDEMGFDSYNVFEILLENPYDFYVPAHLVISRTNEIKMFDDYDNFVLLEPGSEKRLMFPFKLQGELSERFVYTFKFSTETLRGASSETLFEGNSAGTHYSLQEIRQYIKSREEEGQKKYSKNLLFECLPEKGSAIVSETLEISCTLKNAGNVALEDIDVCLGDDCHDLDLGISQENTIIFKHSITGTDDDKVIIDAKSKDISKQQIIALDVFERPILEITDIDVPGQVKFDESFSIEFIVAKENDAPANNIVVAIDHPIVKQRWKIDDIESKKPFVLNMDKNIFAEKHNAFTVSVKYQDALGRSYSDEKIFYVDVVDVDIIQRVLMFFNRLGSYIF